MLLILTCNELYFKCNSNKLITSSSLKLYIKSKSRYVEYLLNLVGVHCDDITPSVSTLFNVTVLIIL